MLKVNYPRHNRFFKAFIKNFVKLMSFASLIKKMLGNALINYNKLLWKKEIFDETEYFEMMILAEEK